MTINPLNSVGLLLAVGNLVTLCVTAWGLDEPPEKPNKPMVATDARSPSIGNQINDLFEDIWNIDIMLPIVILLVVNSSFQLCVRSCSYAPDYQSFPSHALILLFVFLCSSLSLCVCVLWLP